MTKVAAFVLKIEQTHPARRRFFELAGSGPYARVLRIFVYGDDLAWYWRWADEFPYPWRGRVL